MLIADRVLALMVVLGCGLSIIVVLLGVISLHLERTVKALDLIADTLRRGLVGVICAVVGVGVATAQPPPQAPAPVPWADVTSYATAAINPTIGIIRAARSADPKCQLAQLGLSEAIGNTAALLIKHWVISPRPCVGSGCGSNGMPSGHSMNGGIGSSTWKAGIGISIAVGTGALRRVANRHTIQQIVAGLAIGFGAEWVGQQILTCRGD